MVVTVNAYVHEDTGEPTILFGLTVYAYRYHAAHRWSPTGTYLQYWRGEHPSGLMGGQGAGSVRSVPLP